MQELSRLKADIFQSNLAVHRLMAEDGLETAELATLEAAREAVISLYSLWADASSALSLRKEAEQLRNRETDRPKKRRRKQRLRPKEEEEEERRDGRITASPDDSGYSEAASGADPRADSRLEAVALGEGRLYLTETDLESKQVMDIGATAVAGGISTGGGGAPGGSVLLPAGGRPSAAGPIWRPAATVLRVHVSHPPLDPLPVCEWAATHIAGDHGPALPPKMPSSRRSWSWPPPIWQRVAVRAAILPRSRRPWSEPPPI